MNIAIVGFGFVGKALAEGLCDEVNILKIDPKFNNSIQDLKEFNPEIIFICVPTPMNDDGSQDMSILNSVLSDINLYCSKAIIVLKSTVLPSYINSLNKSIETLVVNPEFLRENFALDDFIKSELILFGSDNIENSKKVSKFYINFSKCMNKDHVFVDPLSASLIKYTINSFLATKVIFFNGIKNIFNKSGTDVSWTSFVNALSLDARIGDSHMQVPGPDGRYGFGGACFPKDTNALYKYSDEIGVKFELLEKVISLNNNIRSNYVELTDREVEQNVGFQKDLKE